jgi:membrane associated rhomboid family serine protease
MATRTNDAAEPPAPRGTPVTVVNTMLVLNIIVFAMWIVLPPAVMMEHFTVSWEHLAAGRIWVLITSVFSHLLLFHLLINMIVLLNFGPLLERAMGSGPFLVFYLVAGIVGSLAHAITSGFLIGLPAQPALGASSALAGVLLFFSLCFPKARVLLFFIIPLPAIVAALAFVAIDIWGLVMQVGGEGMPIGHGAHLGGALVGVIWFVARGRGLREQASRLRR